MARPKPCKFCGRKIGWEKLYDGSWFPVEFNPVYFTPDENSTTLVITKSGNFIQARIGTFPGKPTFVGYIPHAVYCTRKNWLYEKEQRRAVEKVKAAERARKNAEAARRAEEKEKKRIAEIQAAWEAKQRQPKQISFFNY